MRMGDVFYTVCYLILMSGGKKDGVAKSRIEWSDNIRKEKEEMKVE
jgi:hypothetical protein